MTIAELTTNLKAMIGAGNPIEDSALKVWINDSYSIMINELQKVNPDYFTKTDEQNTAVGVQEYSMPEDFVKALMVEIMYDGVWRRGRPFIGNINQIPNINRTDSAQTFNQDEPHYYLIGPTQTKKMGFMPLPTTAESDGLKVWYVYTPGVLGDNDQPDIPAQYHHILKYFAYSIFLDEEDQHAAAERMRIRFDRLVEDMVDNITDKQIDEPRKVLVVQNQDLFLDETGII